MHLKLHAIESRNPQPSESHAQVACCRIPPSTLKCVGFVWLAASSYTAYGEAVKSELSSASCPRWRSPGVACPASCGDSYARNEKESMHDPYRKTVESIAKLATPLAVLENVLGFVVHLLFLLLASSLTMTSAEVGFMLSAEESGVFWHRLPHYQLLGSFGHIGPRCCKPGCFGP